jgi:hypothetical protein
MNKVTETQPEDTKQPREHPMSDFMLRVISEMAERGVQIPVTLITPSGMISGRPLSTKQFFDRFGEAWDRGWPGGTHGFRDAWGHIVEATDPAEGMDRLFERAEERRFIHLEQVSVFIGNNMPYESAEPLRVRLSEVTGFGLGMRQRP